MGQQPSRARGRAQPARNDGAPPPPRGNNGGAPAPPPSALAARRLGPTGAALPARLLYGHGRRRSLSDGALPALAKTPTPLTRRRRLGGVTLHVGQTADVLLEGVWLPGQVTELAGDLCRLAVVVPARELTLQQALAAAAAAAATAPSAAPPSPQPPAAAVSASLPPLAFADVWLGLSELRHRCVFPVGARSGVGHAQLAQLWRSSPLLGDAHALRSPSKPTLAGSLTHAAHSAPPLADAAATTTTTTTTEAPSPTTRGGGGGGGGGHVTRSSVLAAHLQHQELLAALRPGMAVDARDAAGAWRPATVLDVVLMASTVAAAAEEDGEGGGIGRGGFVPLPAVAAVDLIWLDSGECARVPLAAPAPAGGGDGGGGGGGGGASGGDAPAVPLHHWPWCVAPAGAVTGGALHEHAVGDAVDVAALATSPGTGHHVRTVWRAARIAQVRGAHVLVRYCGDGRTAAAGGAVVGGSSGNDSDAAAATGGGIREQLGGGRARAADEGVTAACCAALARAARPLQQQQQQQGEGAGGKEGDASSSGRADDDDASATPTAAAAGSATTTAARFVPRQGSQGGWSGGGGPSPAAHHHHRHHRRRGASLQGSGGGSASSGATRRQAAALASAATAAAAAGVDGDSDGGGWCGAARESEVQQPGEEEEEEEEEWVDVAAQAWRLRERALGGGGGGGGAESSSGAATGGLACATELLDSEDPGCAGREAAAWAAALAAQAGVAPFVVDGDGNCLFRALAQLVHGDVRRHAAVRAELCAHMAAHGAFYGALAAAHGAAELRDYLARMRTPGEWGGYMELVAAEELYDRPVEVSDREQWLTTGGRVATRGIHFHGELPPQPGVAPLALSYEGRNHYNALLPLEEGGGRRDRPPATTGTATRQHVLLDARVRRMAEQEAEELARARAAAAAAAAAAGRARVDEEVRRHVRASSGSALRLRLLSTGRAAAPAADAAARGSRRSLVLSRVAAAAAEVVG
jgi:hypothetical protein